MPAPATVWELLNDAPNAFAVGLRKADTAVAVTRGLRASLTTTELQAVLAHEMGHLHAGDSSKSIHIATAVAGMAGMYNAGRALLRADRSSSSSSKKKDKDKDEGSAAGLGVALMAAGMAANVGGHLMRLSVSRGAEFKADAAAAAAYGAPAMISALEKSRWARSAGVGRARCSTPSWRPTPSRTRTSRTRRRHSSPRRAGARARAHRGGARCWAFSARTRRRRTGSSGFERIVRRGPGTGAAWT